MYFSNVKRKHALRRQAHELMARGASHQDIAADLGITRATVWNWSKSLPQAVTPLADEMQALHIINLEKLGAVIDGGAQAYGFASDDWTNARLTVMMEIEFGVCLTSIQTFKLLEYLASGPNKPASW